MLTINITKEKPIEIITPDGQKFTLKVDTDGEGVYIIVKGKTQLEYDLNMEGNLTIWSEKIK